MIVVDASVLSNALADDQVDGRVARDRLTVGGDLVAPDLVDVETVSALRRRWLAGDLTARRFSAAVNDLEDLDLSRFPTLPLMRRAYELRANVTVRRCVCRTGRTAPLHAGHRGRSFGRRSRNPVPHRRRQYLSLNAGGM